MFHPIELINEWRTLANRPPPPGPPRELEDLWQTERAALSDSLSDLELMIVVTTYDRPKAAARMFARLREAVRRGGFEGRCALLVLHDACGKDYTVARVLAEGVAPRCAWLDARQRFGKAAFWKVHQTALWAARAWRPRRALYLQDDLDFAPDFLQRADAIWSATSSDPRRRVLHLFSSQDDEVRGRWVRFARRDFPALGCRLTRWFDLSAFMVDREFFELLDHQMIPIHPNRWKRRPDLSSGVGRQLTLRLFHNANVYQAWPALVRHGSEQSVMNPEARARRPMNNQHDLGPLGSF